MTFIMSSGRWLDDEPTQWTNFRNYLTNFLLIFSQQTSLLSKRQEVHLLDNPP